MIISNTKNKETKSVESGDVVFINSDKYVINGQTEKSWKLIHIGDNPKAKKNETWNKNTFAKKFFFNGEYFDFIRKSIIPNFDYL